MTTTLPVEPHHTVDPTHPLHARRGPFNAWFFDRFDRYINLVTRVHKRSAFEGLGPGRILEIGAGTGANFDYLPGVDSLVLVEPNRAMHARLRRRAERAGIAVEILEAPAERLPLPDASVDTVIGTLVLCTVVDPASVLAEIRRILRPGGTFRFVEHVAAHAASPRRWIQELVARPWRWVFEGCDARRDTPTMLRAAGFDHIRIEHRRMRHSIFVPVNSAIWGIATA